MSTSHGRNKKFCDRYKAEGRQEKNAARRKTRHLKRVAKKRVKLDAKAQNESHKP